MSEPKLWFLTVDWCNQGKRGIFCSKTGKAFSRVVQPLGEDEAHAILGPFALILAPEWELLTPEQVAQHNQWRPLDEFRGEYGYACQEQRGPFLRWGRERKGRRWVHSDGVYRRVAERFQVKSQKAPLPSVAQSAGGS